MTRTPRLQVNGETREYAGGTFPRTLTELIAELDLNPEMVVAEVNGDMVRRRDIAGRPLSDGDQVELVRFVGGG